MPLVCVCVCRRVSSAKITKRQTFTLTLNGSEPMIIYPKLVNPYSPWTSLVFGVKTVDKK